MRLHVRRKRLKPTITWLCLLLLGWVLAASWRGHTCLKHCHDGTCHPQAEELEPGVSAATEPEIEGSGVCLVCQLVHCLQTVSVPAPAIVLALTVHDTPFSLPILVVSQLFITTGSARSPPTF